MTTDLETTLRASLHERADDVEPTPQLWQEVQRRVARRRAVPLLVWTAAGVAAAVTAFAVVPGLVARMDEGFVIDPAQSPTAPASPGEVAPGPVAGAPLTHYVAVIDGRLVLRSVTGDEEVLWEGEPEVRTVAVRPGSAPEDLTLAFVTAGEGMLDLRVITSSSAATTAVAFGPDLGDAAVVPTPAWSPDGRTVGLVEGSTGDLVLIDVEASLADSDVEPTRVSLGDLTAPDQLRLQDWAATGEGEVLSFTALGNLYRATVDRGADGWIVGPVLVSGDEGYVVDIATGEDGTRYRLLAGGSSSGDAEDAGLALEFDNERVPFPDLPTASPADAWMTAVEGGAFVGLGSDARIVHRDPEGNSPHAPLTGVSYAAWVPVAGETADVPKGPPDGAHGTEGPADDPASSSAVVPYVAIQESGRVAVVTGDASTSPPSSSSSRPGTGRPTAMRRAGRPVAASTSRPPVGRRPRAPCSRSNASGTVRSRWPSSRSRWTAATRVSSTSVCGTTAPCGWCGPRTATRSNPAGATARWRCRSQRGRTRGTSTSTSSRHPSS